MVRNGKVQHEGYFKNGLMNGPWKGYYPDGSLKYQTNYTDNVKNGSDVFIYLMAINYTRAHTKWD